MPGPAGAGGAVRGRGERTLSCFCKDTLLALRLPALNVSTALSLSASARAAMALNERLALVIPGLPLPNVAFTLPHLTLSASAVATLSTYAQLRAQAMARLGIDLTTQLGLTALARLTATLNARVSALASLNLNLGPWIQLASLNSLIATLSAVFRACASLSASASAAFSMVVAPPQWGGLHLNLLTMLINMSAQLGVSLSADLVASLQAMASAIARVMVNIAIPLPSLTLLCNLSLGFSAIAQLSASLGINPLQIGFPAVQAMVAANFSAMVSLAASLGINLALGVSGLPNLLSIPGLSLSIGAALQARLRAALALNASLLASLNVGANIAAHASLGLALAATAFTANLSAALGIHAAAALPCPVCDARAIVAAVGAHA